jgi:hypothetical protein
MKSPFRYFNSSPEVIRTTVMPSIRYPLSLRRVEDIPFERGIDICHETVLSGGTGLARRLPRRSGSGRFNTGTVRNGGGMRMRCSCGPTAGCLIATDSINAPDQIVDKAEASMK